MKKILSAAVAVVCVGYCFAKETDPVIQKRIEAIETSLVAFNPGAPTGEPSKPATLAERMAHYKIPGVSLAVINGGKIEWVKGYGTLKAGGNAPVRPDCLFQAASTTKMLVAATALRLVEQGRLDLDLDINHYLKAWQVPENIFTKEKKVTLRLLLTHQAGLPMTNFPHEEGKAPSLVQVLDGVAPAQNKPARVASVPGSQWGYSNLGYVVIQMLLEEVTRKPLPRLMQEVVFTPLGMTASTFAYPLPSSLRNREAMPHDGTGKVAEPVLHPTALAQGGLITTPSDLAKFTLEMMRTYDGESKTVFSRSMVKAMFHREAEIDPRVMGVPLGQGLGVFLSALGSDFSFGHPGDGFPGTTCWVTGVPSEGKGLVIMTNGAAGTPLSLEILAAVGMVYQWPRPQ